MSANVGSAELAWQSTVAEVLPDDGTRGSLAGRIWHPSVGGPMVVAVRADGVFDISSTFPTMRDLCETANPAVALAQADGPLVGSLADFLANSKRSARDLDAPWLLSPVDLQVIKAAGVTFARSMVERVIEERLHGDPRNAAEVRELIAAQVGADLASVTPGSPAAMRLKQLFVEKGLWSQYLEVGIGPDAEIFTKAPVLSSVGTGEDVGVLAASAWNNPEPEVALVVQSAGGIVGATLANDVNLRDIEGRSALLLTKAKDNNASCAIGPLIRFFDASFTVKSVREMTVRLRIDGDDGFTLDEFSDMATISRDPVDLAGQLVGDHHQYPDGAVLLLGTAFAPVADRGYAGRGFTHARGDVVRISSSQLGTLVNRVLPSEECSPWRFGISALMHNLAKRGLL